jgi:hypothetical protein
VGDAHPGGRSGHGVFILFADFDQRKCNQIGIAPRSFRIADMAAF